MRHHTHYLHDRVINVDGGHWKVLLLGELVEAVNSSDALLHNGSHMLGHVAMPFSSSEQPVSSVFPNVENKVGLPAISEGGPP